MKRLTNEDVNDCKNIRLPPDYKNRFFSRVAHQRDIKTKITIPASIQLQIRKVVGDINEAIIGARAGRYYASESK